MKLFNQVDRTADLLKSVLDLRAKNQQVISSNIANAETPGYSARTLEFEEHLKNALDGGSLRPTATHPEHIPLENTQFSEIKGSITSRKDKTGIGDENSVNVDQEMVKLSENQILYEAAITMLNKKMSLLKYTINGGA